MFERRFHITIEALLLWMRLEDQVFLRKNRELRRGPWGLLCCRRIRRSSTRTLAAVAEKYVKKIEEVMRQGQPIRFVLIDFAFKCGRPRWTNRTTPDAGEFWQLAQLRRITEGIKEIYPPGASVCVLTESEVLAPIMGVPRDEWLRYQERLEEFADLLKAPISFLSLKRLVDQIPQFEAVFERELRKRDEVLYHRWRTMFYLGQNTPTPSKALAHTAYARCRAFGAALQELKVVREFLPEHLPISSVATNGHYAYWPVERGCRLLPHRGVPVWMSCREKRIVPLESLAPGTLPVYLEAGGSVEKEPFLYIRNAA